MSLCMPRCLRPWQSWVIRMGRIAYVVAQSDAAGQAVFHDDMIEGVYFNPGEVEGIPRPEDMHLGDPVDKVCWEIDTELFIRVLRRD